MSFPPRIKTDDLEWPQTMLDRRARRRLSSGFSVEVALPVYNEIGSLRTNVLTLQAYLGRTNPCTWGICIVDNGSDDGTAEEAARLEAEHPTIRALCLEEKGKGRALRAFFDDTRATIGAFMDIDLSTNLRYFPLMIEGLRAGFDVAIGTRRHPASVIERDRWRNFVSMGWNSLLKVGLGTRLNDVSCGFKAFRMDRIRPFLKHLESEQWFLDTELLVLSEKMGLHIFEVPVEWVDDRDSKVRVQKVASEYIWNVLKLKARLPNVLSELRREAEDREA